MTKKKEDKREIIVENPEALLKQLNQNLLVELGMECPDHYIASRMLIEDIDLQTLNEFKGAIKLLNYMISEGANDNED